MKQARCLAGLNLKRHSSVRPGHGFVFDTNTFYRCNRENIVFRLNAFCTAPDRKFHWRLAPFEFLLQKEEIP